MNQYLPRFFTILGLCALAAGLAMAIIAGVLAKQAMDFKDRVKHAEGTIVSVKAEKRQAPRQSEREFTTEYWPTVRFTAAGGKPITARTATYTLLNVHDVGDSVSVRYDPKNPQTTYVDRQSISIYDYVRAGMLGVGSLVPFALALVLLLLGFFLRRSPRWVRANGESTTATVTGITPPATGGGPFGPWIIEASGQDPLTNEQREFRSSQLTYDVRAFFRPGQSITVKVDPKRGNRYWVDTTPPHPGSPVGDATCLGAHPTACPHCPLHGDPRHRVPPDACPSQDRPRIPLTADPARVFILLR